jgi:peptidyl-tRNA hydrolase
VTSSFDPDEEATARAAVRRAADAVECVLTDGLETAMGRFNRSS